MAGTGSCFADCLLSLADARREVGQVHDFADCMMRFQVK
jgi:hypothetical protein